MSANWGLEVRSREVAGSGRDADLAHKKDGPTPAPSTGELPASEAFVVLVVDDSDDSREMCAECLSQSGFCILQARTGLEAVELAHRADAVLMDLTLPDIDGLEAARRIRGKSALKRVPLIALTGLCVHDIRAAAKEAGFDRVVGKPCLPDALTDVLREQIIARNNV